VGKDHGTYAAEWENVEGSLGEAGVPWEIIDEDTLSHYW
jgi:hypothetical protein